MNSDVDNSTNPNTAITYNTEKTTAEAQCFNDQLVTNLNPKK